MGVYNFYFIEVFKLIKIFKKLKIILNLKLFLLHYTLHRKIKISKNMIENGVIFD